MNPLEVILDLLFPPKCPFCGKVLDQPGICPKCEAALPWTYGSESLREGPGGLRCAAPLWYEGAVRVKSFSVLTTCSSGIHGKSFSHTGQMPTSSKTLPQKGHFGGKNRLMMLSKK